MRHSEAEIEQAAKRFAELAGALDPATVEALHTEDLRTVAVTAEAERADEARLREAVQVPCAPGRSWNQVAVALGVSRPAARQRFADKVRGGSQTRACTSIMFAESSRSR